MQSCLQSSKVFTLSKGNKVSHFSSLSPEQWSLSPIKRLLCCKILFFQWCNDAVHICCDICAGKVIFWKGSFPSDKIHISFCLCLTWPGCPRITCWDWLRDRGQIKWVLWLAWTATFERNRCRSLAHTDVPIAAEARDWWREDTTARGGSCWCRACLWAWDGQGRGRGGWRGRGERAPRREQTTWITGLKGWPDRVNLNNSEQKTASLLTSPLLHFHWQLSNKHTPSSKTFKRSFSSGFSTKLRGIFFLLCPVKRESRSKGSKTLRIVKNRDYV